MQHGLSRRAALRVLGLGAAGGLLAACAPSAPGASSPTSVPAAASTPAAAGAAVSVAQATPAAAATTASQPKRGGSLKVGQIGDAARLDGQLVTTVDATWMPYDRLTAYDANLKPQPMLAESWDFSSDFKQLKLNLRQGVQFHSGREFTSDDVKWNLMHVQDPKVAAGALILQSKWYTSVETPDKYTVILGSDQPRPATFDFFEFFDIVDSETADGMQTLVGTGPFKFVEWAQGDHMLFARNPNYWQSGLPYLDEVRIVIQKDGQAMMLQLESGALDAADGPPLPDFARLANDSDYTEWTVPSGTNVIGVNTTQPPTDNKLVRQALAYALDRQRIVSTIYSGTGTPQALPWESNSLAFDATKNSAYAFDLDKAKSVLTQAGASNLAFDLVTTTGSQETDSLAQLYQANLATLGITVTIRPYDTATYLDQINNHKYTGAYIGVIAYAGMEPVTRMANSRHLDPSGNSNTGYTSPEYVQLFNEASSEPDS
ncbi:MAG: ABC transporter substrate-binding protein, partial [Chloroflexi bacterium]|nr:ABC transporter substrate-binding protein [Chloroflexota bacterium]